MSGTILIERGEGVLSIRINRPEKKNALDRAMYRTMGEAIRRADADDTLGAVVLFGVPGVFSSGNDIADFMSFGQDGEDRPEVEEFLLALVRSRKPLLAAVDGLAIGIGTTMLMHCDLVLASPGSLFRTPFTDLGLVPEAASSLIAPRLMGHQQAFALLVAGETFDAEAAQRARFVTRIVEAAEIEASAMDAARRLAAKPPEVRAISRDLVRGDREEIEARIRLEIDHFTQRLASSEARQAFARFMARSRA